MKDLKVKNNQLRERFQQFVNDNYQPSLKSLAKAIDIGYQNLVSWRNKKLEYGERNLHKLEKFLDNQK